MSQYPFLIVVNSLIPALLAGNSVILKPSPQTPNVGDCLVEIFLKAGLPKDVLSVLHSGSNETLSQIVKLPEIQLITFTGSTAGGRAIRNAAADRFVPICLELGGNDPAYVRPDADIVYTAAQLVDGAVFNSGQSCCSVERIYVHEEVHDAFVKAVQDELLTSALLFYNLL
jgi:acyl-CoA reductase-like NAD-dependent aldehyde dehydrogenase